MARLPKDVLPRIEKINGDYHCSNFFDLFDWEDRFYGVGSTYEQAYERWLAKLGKPNLWVYKKLDGEIVWLCATGKTPSPFSDRVNGKTALEAYTRWLKQKLARIRYFT